MIKKTIFRLSIAVTLLATALPGSVSATCDHCQKERCICNEKPHQPGQTSSGRITSQADDDPTSQQHGEWERDRRFGQANHTSEIIPVNSMPQSITSRDRLCPLHQGLASGTPAETETTQTNHGTQNRQIWRPINFETTVSSAFSGTGQSLLGATAIPEDTQAASRVAVFSGQPQADRAAPVGGQWFDSLTLPAPTPDRNHLTELTAHAQSAGYQVALPSVSDSEKYRTKEIRALLLQGQTVVIGTKTSWYILVPVQDSSFIIPRFDLYQFAPDCSELMYSIRERQQNLNQELEKIEETGKIYHWYTASRLSSQTE
ncbi:MAG: hypothetical protein ACPG5T_08330 [Endozoicomonas sp.]